MELRHLRYFQVLGQTLNFTRAAERLHIAQPPLSRQIQQLEEELGVILLERGRPLRLTEAGRFFYEHANVLLEQLAKVCDNTRRIGQGEKTWLGIGFAPSTLYGVLPELIRRLRSHEALELELGLSEMTTLQQVEALKAGRIDVGFGRIRIDDPAIVQRVLVEDRLVAVLPAGHPLLDAPATLAQLAAEPFVLYPGNPRPSYADHVIALFDAHGLSLKVAQWTNELQTAIGLVGAGMGVTLVPASVQVLHRADIGYTPVVEATATSPIILSRRVNDQSPGLSLCLQLVEDRLVAVLPAGHPLLDAPATLAQLAAEPFVLYPGNPRPSYADHVIALFDAHGLSLKVAQWTNELQTAIGLVGAGMGVTLVPASVQVLHRADIGYTPVVEATATSPIILSRRVNDQSPGLSHCLQLVEELI